MDSPAILVPVDRDSRTDLVLATAIRMALALHAPLDLLHVLPLAENVDEDVLRNPSAHPAATRRLREAEARVAPFLRELGLHAREAGATVQLHLAHGDPASTVLEVQGLIDAGMIVMGSHGREGVARLALGSVAEAVLRRSPVPVLTISEGHPTARRPLAHHQIPLDEA